MPANISNVSFANPVNLIDPTLGVSEAQVQRQQDLAAALRQMSMEPTTPIDGGNLSITQGIAKLAQALAGRVVQNRADKQQLTLNQAYAQALRNKFQPQGTQPGAGGQAPTPSVPPSIAPAAPTISVPDSPNAPPSGAPVGPSVHPMTQGQPDPMAALPRQAAPQPQQAPPQQMAPAPAQQRGDWQMTNDWQGDMNRYAANPEEYTKALIANAAKSGAPTDAEILINHARQAEANGDHATATALAQQAFKLGYIPEVTHRGGSWGKDPMTGKMQFYPNAPTNGAVPTTDANGNMSWALPTGTTGVLSDVAQADASGKAKGGAPYELVKVKDATGAEWSVPKSVLLANQAPTATTPAQQGGLNKFYNQPTPGASAVPSNAPPGAVGMSDIGPRKTAAETATGAQSAAAFDAATKEASGARNQQMIVNHMLDEIDGMGKGNQLPTGAGAAEISHLKSGWNSVAGALGVPDALKFDPDKIARFDELKKNTAQLGLQLAGQASGKAGATDARLATALAALPGAGFNPAANHELRTTINGLAEGAFQHAQAKALWAKNNGTGGNIEFERQWQQAYNPDIFYHAQKGDFQQWTKGMSPYAARGILQQYRSMKALGAFQ